VERRIFLLSPASLTGIRAKQMTRKAAQFAVARLYRSDGGVEIADAFSFMSALYFRGKIAYAKRFASPEGIFVIAPGYGLVGPEWKLDPERMKKMRRTAVDVKVSAYRRPLEAHARELASTMHPETLVVLLGSIATGKYIDILWPIFGDRLRFPASFAGIGDMSRGALMLRAAASGVELEYATLDAPRHGTKKRASLT
jgi:hypothetical protein